MKVLVLFGSISDKDIYEPLTRELQHNASDVEFEVISAHRNPDQLSQALKVKTYDIVVAGAGLAAHLPGVIASKTKRPVFGIPVAAAFGGLDAFLSILQMPFGVPVLTSRVNGTSDVVDFITHLKDKKLLKPTINFIIDDKIKDFDYVVSEKNRTCALVDELPISWQCSSTYAQGMYNISFVTEKSHIYADRPCIHVPVISGQNRSDPLFALELFKMINECGGIWVGTNNGRNAVLAIKEILG
ncbi:MAG: AIR carboxylase family protein [Bacteriovoracaceae bacterium]|nr:AIR carboxylase family protein [Bacteriovoracaceae bacterium]